MTVIPDGESSLITSLIGFQSHQIRTKGLCTNFSKLRQALSERIDKGGPVIAISRHAFSFLRKVHTTRSTDVGSLFSPSVSPFVGLCRIDERIVRLGCLFILKPSFQHL